MERLSLYLELSQGDPANFSFIRPQLLEYAADGTTLVKTNFGTNVKASLTLNNRIHVTYTVALSGGGTVARLRPRMSFEYLNGASISNVRFKVSAPQLEKASSASSPIITTNAAVTRPDEAITLKLPDAGTKDLVLTDSSSGTQTISDVPGGDYALSSATISAPKTLTLAEWN
jgi:hypothetical protein